MKKLLLTIASIGILNIHAQTYLMDNFAYSTDTLTQNGWTQIGSSAVNPITKSTPALSFAGYVASGLGSAANMANNGQDIYKDITLTSGLNTGQVFVSFLANISAAQASGDYFFAMLPPANTSSYTARLYANLSSPGYFKVAINRWTEARAYSADSFALNQTHLFVIRYVFNTTTSNTDDSVYLYVSSSGVPVTMPARSTAFCSNATSNMSSPAIGRVALRQGSSSAAPTLRIGGLRLATNWADGPLPVTLKSFTGLATETGNQLFWSTSSEINNKGFEIERSENGETFQTIAFVKGAINSQRLLKYHFLDAQTHAPQNYYRLKQIDLDGKSSYSQTIKITQNMDEVAISPNPFTNNISVISSNTNKTIKAEIIDITGKIKVSINGEVNGNLEIDTQHLSKGVYFIRIQDGENTQTKRIIKN